MASTPEPLLARLWREHRPEASVAAERDAGRVEAPAWVDLEVAYLWHERVAIRMFEGGLNLLEASRRTKAELGYSPAVDVMQAFNALQRFPRFPAGTGKGGNAGTD